MFTGLVTSGKLMQCKDPPSNPDSCNEITKISVMSLKVTDMSLSDSTRERGHSQKRLDYLREETEVFLSCTLVLLEDLMEVS